LFKLGIKLRTAYLASGLETVTNELLKLGM